MSEVKKEAVKTVENPEDYQVLEFTDIIVQKILNRNISRAYYLMMGNGGYYKSSEAELENIHFTIDYREFREEAKLESALIYCEAVNSYDSNHVSKKNPDMKKTKFTTWLYWKLRDLDGRMWRLFASGTKDLDRYLDAGKSNNFEAEFLFRNSLSSEAVEILAMVESGIGFKLKKSREYDGSICHIGIQNFWESFIRDNEDMKYSYREFLSIWQELKKGYQSIESDDMLYLINDSIAV